MFEKFKLAIRRWEDDPITPYEQLPPMRKEVETISTKYLSDIKDWLKDDWRIVKFQVTGPSSNAVFYFILERWVEGEPEEQDNNA